MRKKMYMRICATTQSCDSFMYTATPFGGLQPVVDASMAPLADLGEAELRRACGLNRRQCGEGAAPRARATPDRWSAVYA